MLSIFTYKSSFISSTCFTTIGDWIVAHHALHFHQFWNYICAIARWDALTNNIGCIDNCIWVNHERHFVALHIIVYCSLHFWLFRYLKKHQNKLVELRYWLLYSRYSIRVRIHMEVTNNPCSIIVIEQWIPSVVLLRDPCVPMFRQIYSQVNVRLLNGWYTSQIYFFCLDIAGNFLTNSPIR